MNKFWIILVGCFVLQVNLLGQETISHLEGEVLFITSSNIYVRFQSTEHILIGDTLFIKSENQVKKILNFDYPEASRRGIRQNFSDQKDRKPDFLGNGAFSKQHIIDPEAEPSENSQIKSMPCGRQ